MHRRLLGDDAAFLLSALLLVALDHVDAAYQGAIVGRAHLDHLAAAALVTAGEHHDLVALADLCRHHSTSGASEMIFMWFLARSSRGTGPKMRVPTGSICGLINTAALLSKRMTEPSGRLISLRIRTTTAFITSPFLTRPRGAASLIETTMTSPIVAYFRLDPPSTLMHMTRRAPELSATSRLVCIWIIDAPLPLSYALCAARLNSCPLLAPDDRPALQLRNRAVFLEPDDVADGELVGFVVGVILLRTPHGLFQDRVREAAFDADNDGLVLLVAHHGALQHPLRHRILLTSPFRPRASARRWF